jgi:hypothetical protein
MYWKKSSLSEMIFLQGLEFSMGKNVTFASFTSNFVLRQTGNEMGPTKPHTHELVDQSQSKEVGPVTAADACVHYVGLRSTPVFQFYT